MDTTMRWPPPEDWAPNELIVDEICRSNRHSKCVVVCVVMSGVGSDGTSVGLRPDRLSNVDY